jgi:NgoMIV restriction enzyme
MPDKSDKALIARAREQFHTRLLEHVLTVGESGVASNADKSSVLSTQLAGHIAKMLESETGEKLAGQTSGNEFETMVAEFVTATFSELKHIRPGDFTVQKMNSRAALGIAQFEQYRHLAALKQAADENPVLAVAIGRDYTIAPDVVVWRDLLDDDEINEPGLIVDDDVALKSDLRKKNGGLPLLHASISAKWTIRSDRAQNSRSEALNLVRNRKGGLPHIMVVTAEPLPSRLSSLALGTGDIDCVYHFALYELLEAVKASANEEAISLMNIMVEGKRLKDISDLPLDLAT